MSELQEQNPPFHRRTVAGTASARSRKTGGGRTDCGKRSDPRSGETGRGGTSGRKDRRPDCVGRGVGFGRRGPGAGFRGGEVGGVAGARNKP